MNLILPQVDPDLSQMVPLTDRLGLSRSFKKKSYTREDKIRVLTFYKNNGCNLYKTCQEFNLNTKNVLRLIKDEKKITESKGGARSDIESFSRSTGTSGYS